MAKIFYPDFFNDVFGPIMQPGSSGGFAGPARIGNVARHLINEEPQKVVFSLQHEDIGRFKSLGNFMTDRGYLGGVQGFATDDKRLFDAHRLAQEKKLSYEFRLDDGNFGYFRAVKINVYGESSQGELIGASVGGGMIRIYEAYGYKLNWQADTFGTLVIGTDTDLDNLVSKYIEKFGDHVVEHRIVTNADDREALFIETDIDISDVDDILAGGAGQTVHLPAVLPVVTTKAKRKQLFTTVEEWRQVASDRGISFLQAAIEYEKDASGWSEEEIWAFFTKIRDIFDKQIHSLEELDYDAEDTPTLPIYGKLWKKYLDGGKVISDSLTRHILTHA